MFSKVLEQINIKQSISFIVTIVLMGILGVLTGGAVEKVVTQIPRSSNHHQQRVERTQLIRGLKCNRNGPKRRVFL